MNPITVSNIKINHAFEEKKIKIANQLSQIALEFSNGKGRMLEGSGGLEFIEREGKRIFGVHKDNQNALHFQTVRAHILQNLGVHPDTKTVQIVGDSGRFSLEGTKNGKEFLEKRLPKNHLILWGYTGKESENGCTEVNQMVNQLIEADPSFLKNSLANVVDFHTVEAITKWGCSIAPNNQNFYLVYGNAKFGDDMISSDYLTDEAFIIEGGIQSFGQLCNFISKGIPSQGIYNLRGENNPDGFNAEKGQFLTYFSTCEFIDQLKKKIENEGSLTKVQVENFKNDYLKPQKGPERHLFNPSRADASTKQALFDTAWKQFIEKSLWMKLDLCIFQKAL